MIKICTSGNTVKKPHRQEDGWSMKDRWQMEWRDYYTILQMIPEAEPEAIEGVYKKLAAKYHPDNRKTGDADRFRLIHEAYEILTHPMRKREYDAAYKERLKNRDRSPISTGDRRGEKSARPVRTPAPSKNFGVFCSIGSCFGMINEKGECSVCGKAYSQEAKRKIQEVPQKPTIDRDL
jgi:DnaJ-class molecular chaperone